MQTTMWNKLLFGLLHRHSFYAVGLTIICLLFYGYILFIYYFIEYIEYILKGKNIVYSKVSANRNYRFIS